jgi:large subunit ribosomal protein L19e
VNLKKKRRMLRSLTGVGSKRIKFDPSAASEIKNAITKSDSRGLIKSGIIVIKTKHGSSRARARKKLSQKRKGRQKGWGSRKGSRRARLPGKEEWMDKIRAQRTFLRELRESGIITKKVFREIYRKSKGGFFRSRRHIKIYLQEHELFSQNQGQSKQQEKPKSAAVKEPGKEARKETAVRKEKESRKRQEKNQE